MYHRQILHFVYFNYHQATASPSTTIDQCASVKVINVLFVDEGVRNRDRWESKRVGEQFEQRSYQNLLQHDVSNLVTQCCQTKPAAAFQVREDDERKSFPGQKPKVTGKALLYAAVRD
jgi:hypothetical protein